MSVRFNPPSGWPQNGRAFNHGVVSSAGRMLHMTGQVAWDGNGQLIGDGDAAAQMIQCVENASHILAAVGGRLDDIVSLTIYFLRPEDLPSIQKIRADHFPPATAPASILIQTPGLVAPELLVELVPIAVIPEDRYRDPPKEMTTGK